jgi:hypothetical protein
MIYVTRCRLDLDGGVRAIQEAGLHEPLLFVAHFALLALTTDQMNLLDYLPYKRVHFVSVNGVVHDDVIASIVHCWVFTYSHARARTSMQEVLSFDRRASIKRARRRQGKGGQGGPDLRVDVRVSVHAEY